jgi:ABC-type nitrate/sulfonate/bicarbonate transport system substrate-binding protein
MLAVVIGLAGLCAPTVATAADKTPVKVGSTSKEIFDNLAFYVAADAGMFEKQGLAVELSFFRGGGEVVRAVASGSTDISMVAATAAILAAGTGQNLKIIAGLTAPSYGILWIVPTDSPIKSIADLSGKSVGFSRPGSVSHTALIAALQANGIQDKVKVLPIGSPGDSWAAVKAGRLQASWHTVPNVYNLVDKGEARILFHATDYLKDYQQGTIVAMEGYLAKNGETARKLLKALAEAVAYIGQNPSAAVKIGAKEMDVSEKEVAAALKGMPQGWFRVGAPAQKDFDGAMAEAEGTGALKQKPAYDAVVDKRFLP